MGEIPEIVINLEKGEISKLNLNPGDRILISVDIKLSTENLKRIKDQVESLIPGYQIIIMDQGLKFEVIGGENGK